jgi:hypothetical protein
MTVKMSSSAGGAAPGTFLINRVWMIEECPQGLPPKSRRTQKHAKAQFFRARMSEPFETQGELKLRPPETHL